MNERRIPDHVGDAQLPSSLVEVPGVGVCQNDLHFLASTIARGLGGSANPETPLDIVKSAVCQASFELKLIAEKLVDGSDEYYSLLGIADRLDAAAESAGILFKLLQLPHVGTAIASGKPEVQP